ncbi:MAG TPA: SdrD B-like domain-containing protein, partial [Candidatus Saccharimonadia bacterium]
MRQSIQFKREHIPYLIAFAIILAMYLPRTFAASAIEGTVFKDLNRNSVQDPGELGVAGLQIGLIDKASGSGIAYATTDANGHYTIAEKSFSAGGGPIPDGNYLAYISAGSEGWWAYRNEWFPTDNTVSVWPLSVFSLAGSASVNFPIRPIVQSSDRNQPISSYVGSSGLKTHSFNDVYDAKDVHDSIMRGGYVGEEAKTVT